MAPDFAICPPSNRHLTPLMGEWLSGLRQHAKARIRRCFDGHEAFGGCAAASQMAAAPVAPALFASTQAAQVRWLHPQRIPLVPLAFAGTNLHTPRTQ